MGLTDNYTGIGMSPRPTNEHQAVLSDLLFGLRSEDIYTLQEARLDSQNINAKAPDINIYENKEDQYPIIIIEVTTSDEVKTIISKVEELMNEYETIKEAFVYNYETGEWFSFRDEAAEFYEADYSMELDVYFSDYIE